MTTRALRKSEKWLLDQALVWRRRYLGRSQTRKPRPFLQGLWADLRLLFAPELTRSAAIRTQQGFTDDAIRSDGAKELIRRDRHAILRQALEKQKIRETLWPRFRNALLLAAPITYPFSLLFPTIWATGMLANHQVWEWFSLNFCAYQIESWFSRQPNSSRSHPSGDHFVEIHFELSHCRDRRSVASLSVARPEAFALEATEEEMDAIFAEIARCRTRWRIRHYIRIIAILCLIVCTFWLMPYAIRHRSPFG
jgi:hypothetical protein